jgi:ABC-type branched-subunit amino acid transport system ATPase component
MAVADYAYVLTAGRIVFHGPPAQLAEQQEVLNRHLGI